MPSSDTSEVASQALRELNQRHSALHLRLHQIEARLQNLAGNLAVAAEGESTEASSALEKRGDPG